MSVELLPYSPLEHARQVLALWDEALGSHYPIAERIFWSHTIGHLGYEPGDGVVAVDGGHVVGFALAQVDRLSSGQPPRGGPAALMVAPSWRRRGIGRDLLTSVSNRALSAGVREVFVGGASLWRFWPGIPTDLSGAQEFFAACGYTLHPPCADLVRDVSNFEMPARCAEALAREGVVVKAASEDSVARVLAFERQTFAGWEPAFRLSAVVDADHLLVAWHGDEIVGTQQVFSPQARFRGANVVWERLLGSDVGGIGAVGIAPSWRGHGLGLALVAAGCEILRQRGVRQCVIDWTNLVDFYGKLGFRVWRTYRMATLPVPQQDSA